MLKNPFSVCNNLFVKREESQGVISNDINFKFLGMFNKTVTASVKQNNNEKSIPNLFAWCCTSKSFNFSPCLPNWIIMVVLIDKRVYNELIEKQTANSF